MINSSPRTIFRVVEGSNWHLRKEGEAGVLIINGDKIVELNRVAFDYVWHYLKFRGSDSLLVPYMSLKYGTGLKLIKRDWLKLKKALIKAAVCYSDTGIELQIGQKEFAAPIRVDIALTYLCNNDCFHCYAGGSHKTAELTTSKWQAALDKLWKFGVPQVAFTGGESLLREDLKDIIGHAKGLGMITGLITNGRLLTKERVQELRRFGLDFVQITIESHLANVHNEMVRQDAFNETVKGIINALDSSLRVTTNTTMTKVNAATIIETVSYLQGLGVKNIGLNSLIRSKRGIDKEGLSAKEIELTMDLVKDLCEQNGTRLIWFTPTCYHVFNPLKQGLGTKRCSAASTVLAIEPDGRIIPCQSYFEGLGNITTDRMETVWHHPLAEFLRGRTWVDDKCRGCDHFLACGGACPLLHMQGKKVREMI